MSHSILIPYLWNPSINLKKEPNHNWKTLDIFHQTERGSYLSSITKNNQEGKLKKVTNFDQQDQIISVITVEYPNAQTEVTQLLCKGKIESKDIKKFNKNGFLIEHVEESLFGGFDVTQYSYNENNQLIKIIQKEEDGDETWESFTYKNNKLFKIETENSDGGSLFRGFIYDEKGLLEKMIRMQGNLINMEVKYYYDSKGQKIKEIHESTNRSKNHKNSLMIMDFNYHSNGILKEENLKTMDSYQGKMKSEQVEYFNESGLTLKVIENDFEEESKEIYLYKYKRFD